MPIEKLTDGFIAYDFADGPAVGVVRAAPKILQGGAKEMARAMTYRFGILNMAVGGASAGINAPADSRDATIDGFVQQVAEPVASGRVMLDPGKGTTDDQLTALRASDSRNDIRYSDVGGLMFRDHLTGMGAAAATARALGGSIDGIDVTIDGGSAVGIAAAREVAKRGGKIVAIASSKGTVANPDGIDPSAISDAWASSGEAFVEQLGYEVLPAGQVFGIETSVLMTGSKMGAIDHVKADGLPAAVITPLGPVPYTTKATIVAQDQGTIVLPDFVTTAGSTFGDWPPGDVETGAIEQAAVDAIERIIDDTAHSERGPVLEACMWAESFIKTWQEKLPFGRPFA